MASSISGSTLDPYSQFYTSPEFMQNQMNYIGSDIQNQEAQWKESQEEMQQDLPSLID